MKNRFILCLLVGLLLGGSQLSSAKHFDLDNGGSSLVLIDEKQGVTVIFTLPEHFTYGTSSIKIPLFYSIEKDGKILYSGKTQDLSSTIPSLNLDNGLYLVYLSIGDYHDVLQFTM